MPTVGDLGSILVLALAAALNPTLLAATTLMMLLPETKKLMFGYLLGAYLTSISLGLVIVFSLHGSGATSTARNSLTPAEDLVLGAIALTVGIVLRTGRVDRLRERRRQRKGEKEKKESWPERMLGRGSARVTFAVGAALALPGASYLVALDRIAKLDAGPPASALLVIVFCLIQMLLLEVPLIGFVFAPERTQEGVTRFREWVAHNAKRVIGNAAIVIGVLLLLRGVIELLL
jgi:hypothetical protein